MTLALNNFCYIYPFNKETIHIRMILVHSTTQSSALKVQNFNRIPENGNFSDFVYCLGEKTICFFIDY